LPPSATSSSIGLVPKAVLLDVDGTLVDSNDAHARAWVEALSEAGFDVPFARVRPLIGMGGDQLLPRVTGLSDESPAGKRVSERRAHVFRERHLAAVRPYPCARQLLERMRADGAQLVVASSAKADELDALLAIANVRDLVEDTTSSDDAERSKPDPDIVHAALAKAECTAAEALFLGDTPYDVAAGRKAGVGVIALRCGGWRDPDLAGALAIYDDPADLLARYADSPFAR
jgi:HAD superfamily hydrolase (TIGR01509 family)